MEFARLNDISETQRRELKHRWPLRNALLSAITAVGLFALQVINVRAQENPNLLARHIYGPTKFNGTPIPSLVVQLDCIADQDNGVMRDITDVKRHLEIEARWEGEPKTGEGFWAVITNDRTGENFVMSYGVDTDNISFSTPPAQPIRGDERFQPEIGGQYSFAVYETPYNSGSPDLTDNNKIDEIEQIFPDPCSL